MTKTELLNLANKGKTKINGISLEVIVFPSSLDGPPWIEINVDPLSPLHQPLILGQKWVEYVTEEECEELPAALLKYKEDAERFCELAKQVVKATINSDGTFTFIEVPKSVKQNFKEYPSAFKKWLTDKHHIKYVNDSQKEWFAPGNFTLELDGIVYEPHWSYWLDRPYYFAKTITVTKQTNPAYLKG